MMLPISTYDLESPVSTSRLVNCYPESLPKDARSPVVLQRCPGIKHYSGQYQHNWNGPVRVMKKHPANNDHMLIWIDNISGSERIVLDETTVYSSSVGGGNNGEYWDVASDASSLMVVVNKGAFRTTWSGGSSYTDSAIGDTDFTSRGAEEVEFLDNYFLFREPASARFFGSDVGAPTAYTSTSFGTAEAAGDLLVGIKANNANLFLFGAETIEIWDAVGGSGFPFRRVINGAINKGCANGRTIEIIDGAILWVADDRTVRMLQGMEPVKVSNFAIDRYLQKSDSISSGKGFTYSYGGHNFYVLRFSDRCFVYDLTLGLWHERKTIGANTWAYGVSEKAFGKTWFARDLNPLVYQSHIVYPFGWMDDSCYFELQHTYPSAISNGLMADVPMTMEWTYQPVYGAGQRIFHDRLEIVVQTGVGNSDATDPVVHLQASDDGGETWYSFPDRIMGAAGKTFQRVVWHNLGSSYQRVYKASVSDPVPVRVMSTELTAKGGRV